MHQHPPPHGGGWGEDNLIVALSVSRTAYCDSYIARFLICSRICAASGRMQYALTVGSYPVYASAGSTYRLIAHSPRRTFVSQTATRRQHDSCFEVGSCHLAFSHCHITALSHFHIVTFSHCPPVPRPRANSPHFPLSSQPCGRHLDLPSCSC